MEERTVQPVVKGHYATMCRSKKTLRRLEEEEDVILGVITAVDSRKRTQSRGTASVNSLELQDQYTKIRGTQTSWSTAKGLTLEWTPEPMSQSSQEDTSLRTIRWFRRQTRSFSVQERQKSTSSVSSSDTDNRTHRNEEDFVCCRQSSGAISGQTSDMFVVGNLQEPFLGRPAIEALHLLERVNTLQS